MRRCIAFVFFVICLASAAPCVLAQEVVPPAGPLGVATIPISEGVTLCGDCQGQFEYWNWYVNPQAYYTVLAFFATAQDGVTFTLPQGYTLGGIHLIDGQPVEDVIYANDSPITIEHVLLADVVHGDLSVYPPIHGKRDGQNFVAQIPCGTETIYLYAALGVPYGVPGSRFDLYWGCSAEAKG